MSQDPQIQLNTQIRLMRVPTDKYPHDDKGIFQIKISPPTPTDKIPQNSLIIRNLYASIDATMRVWISGLKSYLPPVKPGDVMRSSCIGQVLYSKSKKFEVGDLVMGLTGWQKFAVLNQKQVTKIPKQYPNPQHFLGVYGISGLTAYVGLHEIGKIQKDDIVVISAAAGAVGEIAVQLAKYHGCNVCGIAGSDEKCKYLKQIGADETINYKNQNIKTGLKNRYPKGIDVYFDNVGGQMLDDVLMNIRQNCRIVLCGLISSYNSSKPYKLKNYSRLIIKRGTMQGYLYFDYVKKFKPMITQLMKIMGQGKLKTRIDMSHGIDQCPNALVKLLTGNNNGKVIVKINNPSVSAKL